MTEVSYFWNGTSIGDAGSAPYTAQKFMEVMGRAIVFNKENFGVIRTGYGATSQLKPYSSGAAISVTEGVAIIDHHIYITNGWSSSALAAQGYYSLVLRCDYNLNTVRLEVLGPEVAVYPTVTQTIGVLWEIKLADFYYDFGSGSITILTDRRKFIVTNTGIGYVKRVGNNAGNWNEAGTTEYYPNDPPLEAVGSSRWTGLAASSGTLAVVFPYYETSQLPSASKIFGYKPIVVCNCNDDTANDAIAVNVKSISLTGFTIVWESVAGTNHTQLDFNWRAIGPQ